MAKTGRNDPCPCGSGKKFKRCCLSDAPAKAPEERRVVLPGAWDSGRIQAQPLGRHGGQQCVLVSINLEGLGLG
jgi:hypothetical protein